MIEATVWVESMGPYSQSRFHNIPRDKGETADDHEKRTWRERLHIGDDGRVYQPPMAWKNLIAEAAKFLSMQVPGKGKATYTKHFEAGILVTDALVLDVKKDDVEGEWLFVPADGKRGSGKRVLKCFPIIRKWSGPVTFYIVDPAITEDVFRAHIEEAGKFIGIGRFRPRNNGIYGRFKVTKLSWKKVAEPKAA